VCLDGSPAKGPHGCRSRPENPDKWVQAHALREEPPSALQGTNSGEEVKRVPRYIGLDLHRDYIHGCEFQPEGPRGGQERHFRFPNTPQAWTAFCGQLDRDTQVAFEVTGSAFEVHDSLSPRAGKVLVANPLELRRLGSGRHTDRADAARLAKLLALDAVPTVWVPPQPVRQVRRLLACRERLDSYRRALENQARATLRRHHIRVPPRANVQEWVKMADTARLPAGERAILLATLQAAQALKARMEDLTAQITQRVADVPEVRLLLTLTGVGLLTAAAIWARLGDPHRFSGPKQVARYAGLDPSVDQSGQRDRRGRITRHGDGLLRRMLIEAAWSAARHDTGSLGEFYRRKVKQLGARRALVALARKLLIVAWRMLQTGEPYRACKPALVHRKEQTLRRLLGQPPVWQAIHLHKAVRLPVQDPPVPTQVEGE